MYCKVKLIYGAFLCYHTVSPLTLWFAFKSLAQQLIFSPGNVHPLYPLMFEHPRGTGEETLCYILSRLMSLSNKLCVGLNAFQREKQKKTARQRKRNEEIPLLRSLSDFSISAQLHVNALTKRFVFMPDLSKFTGHKHTKHFCVCLCVYILGVGVSEQSDRQPKERKVMCVPCQQTLNLASALYI